jgi:bifunctional phosphoglucose/phosphomannose isomerase
MGTKNINPADLTDDQELANALAGVSKDVEDFSTSGFNPLETGDLDNVPLNNTNTVESAVEPTTSGVKPATLDEVTSQTNALNDALPVTNEPLPEEGTLDVSLLDIKNEAIEELMPILDHLKTDPEEKFNAYLLLLRSTDNKDLIKPALSMAKQITDEEKRASALLDIIKEIDYLSKEA